MGSFAKIDENSIVIQVISCDEETAKMLPDPEMWIQTSRNTVGGVHSLGGTPLRKNYAAIGCLYDKEKDAFIPHKPYDSWILNEETCLWDPPISMPQKDGYGYTWNEENKAWDEFELIVEPDTP